MKAVWSVMQDSVLLPGFQWWCSAHRMDVRVLNTLCVCIFTLPGCKFCMCWGQARHNPRNLINWLCHKLLSLVFSNYNRSDNIIPYGLKNAVRELKEFLVSVCVGDNFYRKDCHNTWSTVSAFLQWLGDFEASEAPTWWFGGMFSIYFRFQKNGKWYNSYKNSNYWPLDASQDPKGVFSITLLLVSSCSEIKPSINLLKVIFLVPSVDIFTSTRMYNSNTLFFFPESFWGHWLLMLDIAIPRLM